MNDGDWLRKRWKNRGVGCTFVLLPAFCVFGAFGAYGAIHWAL